MNTPATADLQTWTAFSEQIREEFELSWPKEAVEEIHESLKLRIQALAHQEESKERTMRCYALLRAAGDALDNWEQ